ncbi:acyltransferase domain-containing protein [Nonomuraea ferruginea]
MLSPESALALVAHRARLIGALPEGSMSAVPLSAAEARERLARAGIAGVDVAAVSGPELTVLAGEPHAMAAVRALLEADAVPCRPLATTHAFHSAMMEPLREPLTAWIAENVTLRAPRVPYVSNVTGTLATAEQVTDPAYWAEHMCAPVQFDAVLATLLREEDEAALLEIGPGQSLGAMARGGTATAPASAGRWSSARCREPRTRARPPPCWPRPWGGSGWRACRSTGLATVRTGRSPRSASPPTPSSASATGSTHPLPTAPPPRTPSSLVPPHAPPPIPPRASLVFPPAPRRASSPVPLRASSEVLSPAMGPSRMCG